MRKQTRRAKAPGTFSRRDILGAGARAATPVGASSLAMPFVASAEAQQSSVKIGIVVSKQGSWSDQGETLANGAKFALAQAGSRVLQRPVGSNLADEPNPQTAQQNMQKLVDKGAVTVVGAAISPSPRRVPVLRQAFGQSPLEP
jgi:branched-chain amino acid transport system substrate-binding protein